MPRSHQIINEYQMTFINWLQMIQHDIIHDIITHIHYISSDQMSNPGKLQDGKSDLGQSYLKDIYSLDFL